MGVPKFYRWVSERYPCLSQVIQEHQVIDTYNFRITNSVSEAVIAFNKLWIGDVLSLWLYISFTRRHRFYIGLKCSWLNLLISDPRLWQSLPGHEWHHPSLLSSKWWWSSFSKKWRRYLCWHISLHRGMYSFFSMPDFVSLVCRQLDLELQLPALLLLFLKPKIQSPV